MRWPCLLAVLLCACPEVRHVSVTFGAEGEGLDGFMCKDAAGKLLLERLNDAGGGAKPACLVYDFLDLGGVPGCRSGQLVQWCAVHACRVLSETRFAIAVDLREQLPLAPRDELRRALLAKMKGLRDDLYLVAPVHPAMLRVVATAQPCEQLTGPGPDGGQAGFLPDQLVGCAYTCPVPFGQIDQDVYIGFDGLTSQCEQGVRICGGGDLHWQP